MRALVAPAAVEPVGLLQSRRLREALAVEAVALLLGHRAEPVGLGLGLLRLRLEAPDVGVLGIEPGRVPSSVRPDRLAC